MFAIVHTYVKNNTEVLLNEIVFGNKNEQRCNMTTEQDFCRVPDGEKAYKYMFQGYKILFIYCIYYNFTIHHLVIKYI